MPRQPSSTSTGSSPASTSRRSGARRWSCSTPRPRESFAVKTLTITGNIADPDL